MHIFHFMAVPLLHSFLVRASRASCDVCFLIVCFSSFILLATRFIITFIPNDVEYKSKQHGVLKLKVA